MYEALKTFNEKTKLVYKDGQVYICKIISADELPLYKKLLKLSSDNVSKVYETVVIDEDICAIIEFVRGVTLKEYIEKNGAFNDTTVTDFALQLCNGLNDIHALGIVHRDINPNNIIITDDGRLKIIDFSISRIEKLGKSNDTQLLGTHEYAAPEQYGFHQTSNRADIFSFGVVLNFMLTGCTVNEKISNSGYMKIINKCIQIDEANRYKNAREIISDIKKAQRFVSHLRNIPGFRKGVWWHSLIASIYYFFSASAVLLLLDIGIDVKNPLIYVLFGFFTFILPVPIIFNYRGWCEKLPITKNLSAGYKLFVRIALTFLSFVLSFLSIILS